MKAKQHVDQSMTNMQNTLASLQQAINSAEKTDNRTRIQSAMDSINDACQQLSNYKD